LTDDERAVVTLFYMAELDQAQIGGFVGVPISVVKNRLYRARLVHSSTRREPFNHEFGISACHEGDAPRAEPACAHDRTMNSTIRRRPSSQT